MPRDWIDDATERDSAYQPLEEGGSLEAWSSRQHVFVCVNCGTIRPEEERQFPGSNVCASCAELAGVAME